MQNIFCSLPKYTIFSPPVTDELMYGRIQQNNLCIDIEIGHVPAVAKLRKCNSGRDTQVITTCHYDNTPMQ